MGADSPRNTFNFAGLCVALQYEQSVDEDLTLKLVLLESAGQRRVLRWLHLRGWEHGGVPRDAQRLWQVQAFLRERPAAVVSLSGVGRAAAFALLDVSPFTPPPPPPGAARPAAPSGGRAQPAPDRQAAAHSPAGRPADARADLLCPRRPRPALQSTQLTRPQKEERRAGLTRLLCSSGRRRRSWPP